MTAHDIDRKTAATADADHDRGQSAAADRRPVLGLGRIPAARSLLVRDGDHGLLDHRCDRDRPVSGHRTHRQTDLAHISGAVPDRACRIVHGRAFHVPVGAVRRRLDESGAWSARLRAHHRVRHRIMDSADRAVHQPRRVDAAAFPQSGHPACVACAETGSHRRPESVFRTTPARRLLQADHHHAPDADLQRLHRRRDRQRGAAGAHDRAQDRDRTQVACESAAGAKTIAAPAV